MYLLCIKIYVTAILYFKYDSWKKFVFILTVKYLIYPKLIFYSHCLETINNKKNHRNII